jgi:hypothetical protein
MVSSKVVIGCWLLVVGIEKMTDGHHPQKIIGLAHMPLIIPRWARISALFSCHDNVDSRELEVVGKGDLVDRPYNIV